MVNTEKHLINYIKRIKSLAFYHLESAQQLMTELESMAKKLSNFSSFIILEAMEDSYFYYGMRHIKYNDVDCLTIINRHSQIMSHLYNEKVVDDIIPKNDAYFVLISSAKSKVRYLSDYDVFNACNRLLDAYHQIKLMVNRINSRNS